MELQEISAQFVSELDSSKNRFSNLPGNASFDSSTTHGEILGPLDIVIRARELYRVRTSPFFSVTFDEAKDASRSSKLALNFHVIADEGEVDSILAALITVGSTTGLVIVRLILRWGSCNKIDWSRLITAAGDAAGGVMGEEGRDPSAAGSVSLGKEEVCALQQCSHLCQFSTSFPA